MFTTVVWYLKMSSSLSSAERETETPYAPIGEYELPHIRISLHEFRGKMHI